MKIATFNANSIRSRLDIILAWLQSEKPDVLGIQETKTQDHDFPLETFKKAGWNVVYRGEKSYNGVALICRHEPREVKFGFADGGPADQARLVRAVINGVKVVNTYVPQGRAVDHEMYQYKLEWFARLKKLFNNEYTPQDYLIWMGDFNVAVDPIDVYHPETKENHPCYHIEARNALREVCSFGFSDLLRKHHKDEALYSYFDYRLPNAVKNNLGWRIDYIMATPPLAAVCSSCNIDLEPRLKKKPSDHTFMAAELNLPDNGPRK